MQNDEVTWFSLNHGFCSFKVKTKTQTFCRNDYNVTGLCNRVSCPLANSLYGTVMEDKGQCYLHLKTIERAHMPRQLWEKVKLSKNLNEALKQIDSEMQGVYPAHQINRCKQRLTRIRQVLIKMRKLALQPKPKLVPIKKKTERRERVREEKAEAAAKVDLAIEKELLQRLRQGTYGDIYNFPQRNFNHVIDQQEDEAEEMEEEDEEMEDEEDFEGEAEGRLAFLEGEDEEEEEEEEEQDMEDMADEEEQELVAPGAKKHLEPPPRLPAGRRRPRIEIEYEEEMEGGRMRR
ncbi:unnamed protein product [Vitrella brassicaformis CCMP3155]|uniref:Protein MAK16 homolog n=2 Tax=Vitrella brassicaformis TaxID=1169539 RepID=A0A0G4EKA3_VITBC|nr:unnamed protein product [Vitrella brassicaformis CCMP3155]|mmetsp:Transcript_29463/g.85263  ORF Transcript_29463/g.85263 Transcript_29463/m.85263 type:complete len:291 (+) Transcript_29463:120-992(+)|eukprot:CEL96990.1 unnamed protein product [Vitrella brassicaformis CCMP3155]